VPLARELLDPRAARGDEAVLGRDEAAVQKNQDGKCQQLEEDRHAACGRRAVGRSSKRENRIRPDGAQPTHERMFYSSGVRVDYRIEPCRSALNRVSGMPFNWSLNP